MMPTANGKSAAKYQVTLTLHFVQPPSNLRMLPPFLLTRPRTIIADMLGDHAASMYAMKKGNGGNRDIIILSNVKWSK